LPREFKHHDRKVGSNVTPSDDLYNSAVRLLDKRYFTQAQELIDYGLAEVPDSGRLWELRGLAQAAQEDTLAAWISLQKAVNLGHELCASGILVLADCNALADNRREARGLYMRLVDRADSSTEVFKRTADGLAAIGEWGLSALASEEWCGMAPDDSRAWYSLSLSLAQIEGDLGEINDAVNEAVRLSPRDSELRIGVAMIWCQLGHQTAAYSYICNFTKADLSGSYCVCNLRRLQNIYYDAKDWTRSEWCRRLLRR
jgi:tetratricopeptide (TPR) repeat protein